MCLQCDSFRDYVNNIECTKNLITCVSLTLIQSINHFYMYLSDKRSEARFNDIESSNYRKIGYCF